MVGENNTLAFMMWTVVSHRFFDASGTVFTRQPNVEFSQMCLDQTLSDDLSITLEVIIP